MIVGWKSISRMTWALVTSTLTIQVSAQLVASRCALWALIDIWASMMYICILHQFKHRFAQSSIDYMYVITTALQYYMCKSDRYSRKKLNALVIFYNSLLLHWFQYKKPLFCLNQTSCQNQYIYFLNYKMYTIMFKYTVNNKWQLISYALLSL